MNCEEGGFKKRGVMDNSVMVSQQNINDLKFNVYITRMNSLILLQLSALSKTVRKWCYNTTRLMFVLLYQAVVIQYIVQIVKNIVECKNKYTLQCLKVE